MPGIVNAEIYKGLDDEGNVIYSDKPVDNAEAITPPSLTIVDAPKLPEKDESESTEDESSNEEKSAAIKYKTFRIVAPENDETIWNQPQLVVELKLEPALSVADGHNIWLLMDGKPLIKNSKQLSLPIGRSDRGSHTLQALIKNKKGKTLKRTSTITVHIKHSVIKKQPVQQ